MNFYKELGLEPLEYFDPEGDIQLEEFRSVKGFEGLYEISDLGRVKSLERFVKHALYGLMPVKAKIRKQVHKDEYLTVRLSSTGPQKQFTVHQLVAIAFLGHTIKGYSAVVNHKDFNGKNNIKYNLEIVSQRVNSDHKHIPHTSKYTGVNFRPERGRWRAGIYVNGKRIHLGYFKQELEASKAYEAALKEIETI